MSLNILKLCVGAEDIGDLETWQKRLMRTHKQPVHHTRMVPKRIDELLDGGSIYWVIKGLIQVRQPFTDIRVVADRNGRKACEFVLDPELITVDPTPKRPFQGWRYLKPAESPSDIGSKGKSDNIPPALHAKLKEAMVW
ncbi:DUF1489 family protein [Henriciella marina]|uniref:DUF1489 family protein n=1 Tax=Henriciella marina TaxID=453851 RepID=UPI00035F17E5|nr:DUF1489 domain-containing protein [Henriciella marina]